ncbi:manba-prov protein [Aphelenchoides avenae]|nr:manba-prov protein [Aphelenchus avenae]
MNSVRIWGGGLYEDDDFYDHCDRNGILIWHDFMFACAAYPTNKAFLDSVSQEIESQVYRLRHRPSILIWGGNNENELAIQTGWWYELGYSQADMIKDYKTLYKDLMKPLVTSLDASRPFVLSSGLAQNPGDNLYGDVHFYNEAVNLWQDQSYPIPRCATEYGVQSIPLRSTMLKWINASEWHYGSKSLTQRQHHPGGVINQLMMAFQHFEVPSQCGNVSPGDLLACDYVKNSAKFMNRFAFLSQIHQAMAIQTETEHYRRWRARLQDDGKGNTMCAMYWQLNDVWAAPTWSSIDFNLNWKPLHYAAKRFFSNVALSMFIDGSNTVQVFVVSDLTKSLFSQYFRLDMLTWTNGFEPLYSLKKVISVPQLASKQVDIGDGLLKTLRDKDQQDFLIRAQVFASNGDPVTYPSVLVPDKLYKTDLFGDVSLADFEKQNATTYAITLNATSIVPFVWLDLRDELKDSRLLFWFSDNAFVITASSTKVKLVIYVNPENLTLSQNDVTLCSLKTC